MQRVPQVLVNVTLPDRRPLEELPKTSRAIALAEKSLGKNGRVLVRWSGTEPKLRVMIEGPKRDRIETMAKGIADEAKKEFRLAR
jgi:phosphoglucosamine mutase